MSEHINLESESGAEEVKIFHVTLADYDILVDPDQNQNKTLIEETTRRLGIATGSNTPDVILIDATGRRARIRTLLRDFGTLVKE